MLSAYFLYKERGDTSFQAIRKLQKNLALKKVGHCGTLDQFAEGLLIVLSDAATKFASVITGLDKRYVVEIKFGCETDTLDPNGRIIREAAIPQQSDIENALALWLTEIEAQRGELLQKPPAFSAIHSGGKRLYERALAGEELNDIAERHVRLYACKVLCWQYSILKLELHCSKGFYVRSFARDLACRCSSAAHVHSLLRSSIGSISVLRAQKLAAKPLAIDLGDLLLELQEQIGLHIWQTGRDLYRDFAIPAEDWKLLKQGHIPQEIFRCAQQHFKNKDNRNDPCGVISPEVSQEIALLDQGKILALFRYQISPHKSFKGASLKFWHNFCANM